MTYLSNQYLSIDIDNRIFINGEFISLNQAVEKKSPISNVNLPTLLNSNDEIIDLAVDSAHSAYVSRVWVDKSLEERKIILFKLSELILRDIEYLSFVDSVETGRPISNFLNASIPKSVEALRWFIEACDKFPGESYSPAPNVMTIVKHEPLGVVGLITPWNDPLVVAVWKFAPALLMGNSVVIKPSEYASFSILHLAKLTIEAGIPKGVFNVVTGVGSVSGRALALHMKVRGIFFTGSSATGKKILTYAGESNMKKVGLECGGKSPFILSQHCSNLDDAAETLSASVFYNQGQICSAPSRLIIHHSIKSVFLKKLYEASKIFIPNHPLKKETLVGSVINQDQYHKIQSYVDNARKEGKIIYEHDLSLNSVDESFLGISPTIIDDSDVYSANAQEEIFGPVLTVLEYRDVGEAIKIANSTEFGLAASVWSDSIDECLYIANRVESGMVHINSYGLEDNGLPFGGVKQSGLGRDKSLHAFTEYSELKSIVIRYASY